MADKMFTTWDGMDAHAKVGDRANADADGNSLTLGLDASGKVATIGGKEIAGVGGGGASYTAGNGVGLWYWVDPICLFGKRLYDDHLRLF